MKIEKVHFKKFFEQLKHLNNSFFSLKTGCMNHESQPCIRCFDCINFLIQSKQTFSHFPRFSLLFSSLSFTWIFTSLFALLV